MTMLETIDELTYTAYRAHRQTGWSPEQLEAVYMLEPARRYEARFQEDMAQRMNSWLERAYNWRNPV